MRVVRPDLWIAGAGGRPVVQQLGEGATLHVVEGADHAFHVLVRSGRTDAEVLKELTATPREWIDTRVGDAR